LSLECTIQFSPHCCYSDPVFKNSTEWKKSEVAEFDFCTVFLMNSTDFFGEQCHFVNSAVFFQKSDPVDPAEFR
jgi:hypothetical protein